MSDYNLLNVHLLRDIKWHNPEQVPNLSQHTRQWLFEPFSMTKRLKQYCDQFTVELLMLERIEANALSAEEKALVGEQACLVREVILKGDSVPWVYARTLLPMSTLTDQEEDLARLGEMPLGERIFADASIYRDAYNIATLHCAEQQVFARRSRLWIKQKPLLVSELFLPQSPFYYHEDIES